MAIARKSDQALKVADEVFLVVAMMHQDNPLADDFSVAEIMGRAHEMHLNGDIRPGFQVHVRMHCVANMAPNPGDYRMLFASGKSRRRLLRKSDVANPFREGKIFPEIQDVDPKFFEIISWAKARYGLEETGPKRFEGLRALRGIAKGLWKEESADEYIKRLRSDWD